MSEIKFGYDDTAFQQDHITLTASMKVGNTIYVEQQPMPRDVVAADPVAVEAMKEELIVRLCAEVASEHSMTPTAEDVAKKFWDSLEQQRINQNIFPVNNPAQPFSTVHPFTRKMWVQAAQDILDAVGGSNGSPA